MKLMPYEKFLYLTFIPSVNAKQNFRSVLVKGQSMYTVHIICAGLDKKNYRFLKSSLKVYQGCTEYEEHA